MLSASSRSIFKSSKNKYGRSMLTVTSTCFCRTSSCLPSLGLDPAKYAGHSLRAGFVTSACKKGASQFKVMQTARHKTAAMLAVCYRDEEIFTDVAGAGLL